MISDRKNPDIFYGMDLYGGKLLVSNEGGTFLITDGISQIHAFGFGKGAPGTDGPALYLIGVVNKMRGIFRSDDDARNWVRINDDRHQWGSLLHGTGDPTSAPPSACGRGSGRRAVRKKCLDKNTGVS